MGTGRSLSSGRARCGPVGRSDELLAPASTRPLLRNHVKDSEHYEKHSVFRSPPLFCVSQARMGESGTTAGSYSECHFAKFIPAYDITQSSVLSI
jgi:hypothetical protein